MFFLRKKKKKDVYSWEIGEENMGILVTIHVIVIKTEFHKSRSQEYQLLLYWPFEIKTEFPESTFHSPKQEKNLETTFEKVNSVLAAEKVMPNTYIVFPWWMVQMKRRIVHLRNPCNDTAMLGYNSTNNNFNTIISTTTQTNLKRMGRKSQPRMLHLHVRRVFTF